jgi:translation elongation factor EF-1beta
MRQGGDGDENDLFADAGEEDAAAAEARKAKAAEMQSQAAGKIKGDKPAKTNIILDVKGWDDETDMAALEANVRKVRSQWPPCWGRFLDLVHHFSLADWDGWSPLGCGKAWGGWLRHQEVAHYCPALAHFNASFSVHEVADPWTAMSSPRRSRQVVVEDDKVSVDELEEHIREDEDHVQSVDVVTMNKI